jgi:hypothetical protein
MTNQTIKLRKSVIKLDKGTFVDPLTNYICTGFVIYFDDGSICTHRVGVNGTKPGWLKVGAKVQPSSYQDNQGIGIPVIVK